MPLVQCCTARVLCGEKITKNTATRHLAKCLLAYGEKGGKTARLFHRRAENPQDLETGMTFPIECF